MEQQNVVFPHTGILFVNYKNKIMTHEMTYTIYFKNMMLRAEAGAGGGRGGEARDKRLHSL